MPACEPQSKGFLTACARPAATHRSPLRASSRGSRPRCRELPSIEESIALQNRAAPSVAEVATRGWFSVCKPLAVCSALVVCLVSAHAQAGPLEEAANYTGVELYQEHCASCHGEHAHGDGPVAPSLRVAVPDLTKISARQGGTFPVDRVRSVIDGRTPLAPHGTRNMPVWGWAFRASTTNTGPQAEYRTQALIGLLVDYLRSIQQK